MKEGESAVSGQEVNEQVRAYHALCDRFGEPYQSCFSPHGDLMRLMGYYGTKDVRPRNHLHPKNSGQVVYGVVLGVGAILLPTDVYSAARGTYSRWMVIPTILHNVPISAEMLANATIIREVSR